MAKSCLFVDGTNLYAGQYELFGPKQYLNFSKFISGYRSKTSGREKEVDVKLAVDMVEKVSMGEFGNFYLLSGDADFMEALFAARRLGGKPHVLCLENKIMYKSLHFFKTYVVFFSQSKLVLAKVKPSQRLIFSAEDLAEKIS